MSFTPRVNNEGKKKKENWSKLKYLNFVIDHAKDFILLEMQFHI